MVALDREQSGVGTSMALGYAGMHLIHPSHVPIVNEIFTPTAAEIAFRQGLLDAMEQSRRAAAAVTYAGDMVDAAHEETARAMLAMRRSLGLA